MRSLPHDPIDFKLVLGVACHLRLLLANVRGQVSIGSIGWRPDKIRSLLFTSFQLHP